MERRRRLSLVLCLVAAVLIVAGSLLPYGSACEDCRVIAPFDSALRVWLPSAMPAFLALAIAVACGFWLAVTRAGDRYIAGFVFGAGVLTTGYFLAYAVHFDAPFGGVFGVGGLVGMLGGALMVAAGWLFRGMPEALNETEA